jgi:hypothetical protein
MGDITPLTIDDTTTTYLITDINDTTTGWGDNFGWLINSAFYNEIELLEFLI